MEITLTINLNDLFSFIEEALKVIGKRDSKYNRKKKPTWGSKIINESSRMAKVDCIERMIVSDWKEKLSSCKKVSSERESITLSS